MKTLYLLRHAKSDWDDPALADFDRPLAARGRKAAKRIGRALAGLDAPPALILCSPARRARETLDRVLPLLSPEPAVDLRPELYLGGWGVLLAVIGTLPDAVDRAMVVAHNPDMHDLAGRLSGHAEALRDGYPTGALAVLDFACSGWDRVGPGAGRLREFLKPRDLA